MKQSILGYLNTSSVYFIVERTAWELGWFGAAQKSGWQKSDRSWAKGQNNQHVDFPSGHPPEYYPRLSLFNSIERTVYGSLRLMWPIIPLHVVLRSVHYDHVTLSITISVNRVFTLITYTATSDYVYNERKYTLIYIPATLQLFNMHTSILN